MSQLSYRMFKICSFVVQEDQICTPPFIQFKIFHVSNLRWWKLELSKNAANKDKCRSPQNIDFNRKEILKAINFNLVDKNLEKNRSFYNQKIENPPSSLPKTYKKFKSNG